jgi:SAM-dependent methyltransferase
MTDSTPRAPDGPALLGPAFYDHEKVFDAYRAGRTLPDNPNSTLEEPPVIEFLGDLGGRAVLDLGCGDARFGRYALESGALRYVGIDASNRMLEQARRNLRGTRGEVRHADLGTWNGFEAAGFDVVVSRLALHYVEDLDRLLTVVHRCLVPGGLFVLSVEHPVVTSTYDGTDVEEGFAYEWRVRDYFVEGRREDPWLGAVARKVHRTFETYFRALRDAGFRLDALSEATPRREPFRSARIFELRRQVPAYAIFRCLRDP